MSAGRVATCVWKIRPEIVIALAEELGDPTDSYVNGSQTWLLDNGPNEATLEWRMHPVPGYKKPADTGTYDVFPSVVLALLDGSDLPAPLNELWDGLESFVAFDDEIEPQPLADACASTLGFAPDAFGLVEHEAIGDAWEKSRGEISVTEALLEQLNI